MMVISTSTLFLFLSLISYRTQGTTGLDKRVFRLDIDLDATENHFSQIRTGACTFLSIRETHQIHKDIPAGDTGRNLIVESRPARGHLNNGLDSFSIYSNDLVELWDHAESLCGLSESWVFPLDISLGDERSDIGVDDGAQILLGQHQQGDTIWQQYLLGKRRAPLPPPPPLEIIPLITTGPAENRVDLVFFGDGYTANERNKFITDARTLAMDVSGNQTFATVKPLMNFWAAFTPSHESGIGIGGKPKNTTYGLYRDGTELRAVYYALPNVARSACLSLGDACDYPILLGNDGLYGGLGGRFTVTTASELNGPLVLRHELGHSIILVGEEYDGGFAYFGPNAAHSREDPFVWSHWLTTPDVSEPREERSVVPLQAYPWTLLNTSTPWTTSFTSPGTYDRYIIRFSLSGIPSKEHLHVLLDGMDVDWTPRKDIGVDRWFYDMQFNETLEGGPHELKFRLSEGALIGQAQLCSLEVIEYGTENEFNTTDGYIGAFPTFSEKNETSYRPTDEGCLMRLVTTPNFCSVCIEGLWLEMLKRVSLIDNIRTGCALHAPGAAGRFIDLELLSLAQFRDELAFISEHSETYVIDWFKDGEPLPEFTNKTSIEVENTVGIFIADVRFVTDEVRRDTDGYLTARAEVDVKEKCIVGGV